MSTKSFFTAVSSIGANPNHRESLTVNKGRFKVIHFDETDESRKLNMKNKKRKLRQ